MTDETEVTLVLMPLRSRHVMVGSQPITASCGHRAWISPSGVAAQMLNPQTKTLCIDCVPNESVNEAQVSMLPGAREELIQTFGQDAAEVAIQAVRTAVESHGGTFKEEVDR